MKQKQKLPILPMIMIVAGIILYGAPLLYSKLSHTQEQAIKPPVPMRNQTNGSANQNSQVFVSFEGIPSPFATLSTLATTPSSPTPTGLPPIPQLPTGGGFSPVALLGPNGILPTTGAPFLSGSPQPVLTVKAVFYKEDGNNIAVVSDGKDDVVVTEGQTVRWGYVSTISKSNIIVDGKVVPFRHDVLPVHATTAMQIPALPAQ